MDVGVYPYIHGDSLLIDKIVNEFLSQGKFDKLRKECMSDADTKPAYQNLQQRVESTVTQFLKKQVWKPDLNKNQLRDSLRKHILESGFFDAGINRIVDQVVNPNVLATVFLPEVEEVVYNYLSIPRPTDKKKGPPGEKLKPPGSEVESQTSQENGKYEKNGRGDHGKHEMEENKDREARTPPEPIKMEPGAEEKEKRGEVKVKTEERIKSEPAEVNSEETQMEAPVPVEKMEVVSEESQDSLSRMAVDGLQINEAEGGTAPDSDDSVPLEINEKSMSDTGDSEDSIMNQMSPISQGRLTPDIEEEQPEKEKEKETEKEREKEREKEKEREEEEKRPYTFVGRIPKLKREDSESSKSSKAKEDSSREKLDVKHIYSSDESDSSKSYGKSDSDERKSKGKSEKPQIDERKNREESEKRRRDEEHRRSSKDRKTEDRSKERHSRDRKRERSRDRHGIKKSSSSSSSSNARERSSSHHKSSSHSRHKDSKERSKRKEEEKKKSKSTDDHGRERNKKEDRRSTDRDSNERERDRSSGGRAQGGESRRREKEEKTVEGKQSGGKEEAQVEEEGEVVPDSEEIVIEMEEEEWVEGEFSAEKPRGEECADSETALDFGELFRSGAVARLEFPKLTDDFYVKFNSTGFKYFEDWEKCKLDCEEEFKEFVDEAEGNLSLISDDETDSETEFNFDEENQRTVRNLLRGLGNFRRSLMFDPSTSEFYRWSSNKSYQKFRKKSEKRERKSTEKNESDESIKENIDKNKENRERENKALHLKLLNRYRRKAMRMGKPRRRQRRAQESGGIKEKNDNDRSATDFLFKPEVRGASDAETFLGSNLSARVPAPRKTILECGLVESGSVEEKGVEGLTLNELLQEETRTTVTLPESPEVTEVWSEIRKKAAQLPPKCGLPLNLPLSPDSDDLNSDGAAPKNVTIVRKRVHKGEERGGGTPKRQTKRNYSQKYDSQDLYKPRPILNGSRTRGRERGLEGEMVAVGDPESRPSGRRPP